MISKKSVLSFLFRLALLFVVVLSTAGVSVPRAQAQPPARPLAQTNTLTLSVISARTEPNAPGGPVLKGDPVTEYKYLINVDNTGDPTDSEGCSVYDAGYPDSCDWPSVREVPGAASIYTQGDQADFGAGINLPDGKYLISVLADGYKMGGAHFSVPLADPGLVTVELQPHPLPAATMRIKVFEDISPVNGQFDAPAEHGLAGFTAVINDTVGQISTDVFGNPLCTVYDADMNPIDQTDCLTSDANGDIVIPNIGPLRYDVLVNPPDGQVWLETTTLEGSWSWDTWLQEGGTGLDNEFVVAGEPFPWTIFGFVQPMNNLAGGSGGVKGTLVEASIYLPQQGALPYYGDIWNGFQGTKVTGPITDGWIALSDLQQGDTAVYVGPANPDGTYEIHNVPDGSYLFTWWDYNLHHILDWIQVTVANGQMYDMGTPFLTGWFTKVEGYVFIDENKNGVKDPGEPGKADYLVVLRDRDNSEIDRMSISAITDHMGYYVFEKAYPMSSWMVLEAYNDRYYTTGISYHVDNQIDPNTGEPIFTTVLGNGVDVGILPILGQPARLDWGIYPYEAGKNGGIVGSVFYDTTRNELDPRYQAVEPWAAGIPNLTMRLYAPVLCTTSSTYCDDLGKYELAADGSYAKSPLLNITTTEIWEQPTECTARDANGNPLRYPQDQQVFENPGPAGYRCLEAPMMGTQIQSGFATLDGNWGFTEGCFGPGGAVSEGVCADGNEPLELPAGDYLVEVDPGTDARGLPMYQVVREEDINVFGGDQYIPAVPPPACAGALHTVDVAGVGTDYVQWKLYNNAVSGTFTLSVNGEVTGPIMYNAPATGLGSVEEALLNLASITAVTVTGTGIETDPWVITFVDPITTQLVVDDTNLGGAASTTVQTMKPVENPSFADAGGSPFEGMQKPLCDVKLVELANGKSVAPLFTLFTEVPIPGKWKGYIIDDLTVSTNPTTLNFGEKAGVPNSPIGIYDFTNRLVTTIQSDPNGVFEVLLPSTYTMNCPTPSGVCANVYYMLGNDPGQPGALNANYNPQYRTIGASFEIYPGLIIPSDLAPTQIVPGVLAAGLLFGTPPQCTLDAATPQLFAVSKPYANVDPNANPPLADSFTIWGQGFGGQGPGSQVTLDDTIVLPVTSWTDTQIGVTVPATTPRGPHQLAITANNGKGTVNGLTFHVRQGNYKPDLFEVGPGHPYATIQSAIDAAAANKGNKDELVVVYPGATDLWNPTGAYFENLIIYSPVKLQGVGPGGSGVLGSVVDGRGVAGDTVYAGEWRTFVQSLVWHGNQAIYEGPVVYVLAEDGEFTADYKPAIDGFTIQGGDQQGFPANLAPADPTIKEFAAVQGGGIFANAYARHLQITNNVIQSNGGAYAGAIRLGTPHLPGAYNDNQNDFVRIAHNRILANGGTNLAGAVGLFSGSEGYEVAYNDICGNFSAEYGGGISHYGLSPNGKVHHNRVYFNRSYDEGGGIIIAGELQTEPTKLTPGAGPVDVYANLIQNNLGNDDGGGLRFLMAGNFPYKVYNNIIVNNVSTHEGGGVSINDAPDVRVYNNTIMKNITTATAMTSNGQPAPAGLSSSRNSALLQATLPAGSPLFSNPVLFNNIFWDNRAGKFTGATVAGIGLAADPGGINYWDLGIADGSGLLSPTYSVLQTTDGTIPDSSNKSTSPMVVSTYDTSVSVQPWRGNPRFVDILMVTTLATPNLLGDYHITSGSPAENTGATSKGVTTAPSSDIDGDLRPSGAEFDMGADEIVSEVAAFPTTPILDDFNRTDGAVGPNWSGSVDPAVFAIVNNELQVLTSGNLVWYQSFGPNQEAFFTFVQPAATANEQALILKLNGPSPDSNRSSAIKVNYDVAASTVSVETRVPNKKPVTQATFTGVAFAAGNQFGARAQSDGTVCAYKNGVEIGCTNLNSGANPWPSAYIQGSGSIGLKFTLPGGETAILDNFGGGTMGVGFVPAVGPTPMPVPEADLGLSLVDAVDPVTEGDVVTYTLTVTNNGPDAALNVVLTDSLPADVTFVSATADQGGCSEADGVITCSLGEVASGGSVGVEVVVSTTAAGVLTNNASVSSDTADPDSANNSASQETTVEPAPEPVLEPTAEPEPVVEPTAEPEPVLEPTAEPEPVLEPTAEPEPVLEPTAEPEPVADLGLSLVDAVDPVTKGDDVTYTLTVSNNGPDAAQNVVLTGNLPAGVAFVSATPAQGSCSEAGGVVTCNLGEVSSGGSADVVIVVKATAAGVITNNASVTSDTADPNAADNSASQETTVKRKK